MERKMDFWTIEISTKFKSKEQARKLQKVIIDKFYYECGKNKDYQAQVIVGISNINAKYVKGIYNEQTKKSGRPKKIKDLIEDNDINKKLYGNLYTDWHLHILVLSKPSETLARIIKEYIDKNKKLGIAYKKFIDNEANDIDIGMLFYIAKQSEEVMFYGSNDKRFKYTFKQMFETMVKKYTNLKYNKRYIMFEEYRNKLDSKYNDMIKYFSQFYDEQIKRNKEQKYKEEVKRRKIKERYEAMEIRNNANKVPKNKTDKNNKYASIIGI